MRQNIEELQATQEMLDQKDRQQKKEIARLMAENNTKLNELEKKELESKGIIDALNQTTFLIELDFDGTILFVNDYVLRKFSITHADIIGKNQADFMVSNAVLREECKQIWSAIRNGEVAAHISNIQINNQLFWFADTYTPVFDKDGKPYKVLKISHDITENRLRESELKLMADRLKTHEEELRQNLEEMQATQEALALKDEEQQHIIDRLIAENETKIQAIKTNIESELAASNEKHQLQCFTYESMIQDYKNSEVEWHKQMEALKIEIAELRNKID